MKIGDLERMTGVEAATIRYWEKRGLLRASRGDNRYRQYGPEEVELILKIKTFREIGTPVADIKLWCDHIVDEHSLLLNQRRQLESNDRESSRLRRLCDALIEGNLSDLPEATFGTEPFAEADSESAGEERLLLGVDIGTTSVSAQLISAETGKSVHVYNVYHNAGLEQGDVYSMDGETLVSMSVGLVKSALGSYKNIAAIGFTGQMHGIVCINGEGEILSPLYTWQNGFGLRKTEQNESICDEMARITGISTPTGYGTVTLYALKKFGMLPPNTAKVCCISDLAVMRLCGAKEPVCDPTNAASLGFFDLTSSRFKTEELGLLGISHSLFPKVVADYTLCGTVEGVPVAVSVGDNQAAVFGALQGDELSVNIGTSAQISYISDKDTVFPGEVRPYMNGKYLHSGSTLCGGYALTVLAALIKDIGERLEKPLSKKQIYQMINGAALSAEGSLRVTTAFSGTRTDPLKRGSVENIGADNLTLAELSSGFCDGIVEELYTLCREMTDNVPQKQILSGNALRWNSALRRAVEKRFQTPYLMPEHKEAAAYGAALYAAVSAGEMTYEGSRNLIRYITEEDLSRGG